MQWPHKDIDYAKLRNPYLMQARGKPLLQAGLPRGALHPLCDCPPAQRRGRAQHRGAAAGVGGDEHRRQRGAGGIEGRQRLDAQRLRGGQAPDHLRQLRTSLRACNADASLNVGISVVSLLESAIGSSAPCPLHLYMQAASVVSSSISYQHLVFA